MLKKGEAALLEVIIVCPHCDGRIDFLLSTVKPTPKDPEINCDGGSCRMFKRGVFGQFEAYPPSRA